MSRWSWCDEPDTEVGWSWCDRPVSKKSKEHDEEDYWWAANGPQDI